MKKLLFAMALIGVLVGSTLGGIALADKPDAAPPLVTLDEIEQKVDGVQATLDDPATGLTEIKREVKNIEDEILDPTTGLAEIKDEVTNIESRVEDIEYQLADPTTGLAEIKAEVANIEQMLANVPMIEKFSSGEVEFPPDPHVSKYLLEEDFTEVRHVTISTNLSSYDWLHWQMNIDLDGDGYRERTISPTTEHFYYKYFEFDAWGFSITVMNNSSSATETFRACAVTIY
jgi:hypothetical protein